MDLVIAGLYGGLGGILRAIVGYVKAMKEKDFNFPYFMITAALGVFVGIIAGMLLSFLDWRLAFVSGYAGTDVLEGITELFRKGKAYGLIVK